MRNGFRGSLLLLLLAAPLAPAQAPPAQEAPSFIAGLDTPWQPPRTDLEDRPNIAPRGFAFYGQVDYLLWWTEKDHPVHALTAGPGTAPPAALFGEGANFSPLVRHGTQGVLGTWLDPQQRFGLEAAGLWLSNRYTGWRGGADGVGVHNQLASRLWGAEFDARCEIFRSTFTHLDVLGGFRHLSLDESLEIAERDFGAGTVTSDRFGTRNRFYGGQLGLEAEAHYGSWSVDLVGKTALGANCAAVNVNGTTLVRGRPMVGGLLASPAASGRHSSDEFAVVPEFSINCAYELTNNIRLTVGYTFLYLSDVARPAEQIDALQRAPHASFPAANGEFWGQGLNFGLEFRF